MTNEEMKKKVDNLIIGSHSTRVEDKDAVKEILKALVEESEAMRLEIAKIKEPYKYGYLTIEAVSDDTAITWRCDNAAISKTIEVSRDEKTWTPVASTPAGAVLGILSAGEKLYIRGNNPSYGQTYYSTFNGNVFGASSEIKVYGNIMSLVKTEQFYDETTLSDTAFPRLFVSAPVVSAKNLILPATTLAANCYSYMFAGCTSLKEAPALPATTLAKYCYYYMFQGCTSLEKAPELPATTLADDCYNAMFVNCTSLEKAPELPATTLAVRCYCSMFGNCTSLEKAPELPATSLVQFCYDSMFAGCASLNYIKAMFLTAPNNAYTSSWVSRVAASGTFVKNAAATWDVTGFNGIPSGWEVETAAN